jgi:hypothetical protein
MLLTHTGSLFDEELGIKRKHYINTKLAKEWKNKKTLIFHPDKNIDDDSIDYLKVMKNINKIYCRMIGKS